MLTASQARWRDLWSHRYEDQKYGFVVEADCGYAGWEKKVIFNCTSKAGDPFSLIVGYGWIGEQIQPLDFDMDGGDFQDNGNGDVPEVKIIP